jgi:hypothetical protein
MVVKIIPSAGQTFCPRQSREIPKCATKLCIQSPKTIPKFATIPSAPRYAAQQDSNSRLSHLDDARFWAQLSKETNVSKKTIVGTKQYILFWRDRGLIHFKKRIGVNLIPVTVGQQNQFELHRKPLQVQALIYLRRCATSACSKV